MTLEPSFLTKLPLELRLKVYAYLFEPTACRALNQYDEKSYDFTQVLSILLVNRQIYTEARRVFREENLFVRIKSPWPQMKDHVREKQRVPIVCADDRAIAFNGCSMILSLDAPAYQAFSDFDEQFVLHCIDLPHFTQQWALADMSYNLNENLRMTLELDAPYTPSYEEKRLPKQMQRKLLLPFSNVKRLSKFEIVGQLRPYSAVEKELREGQNTPYKRPEACLRDAAKEFAAGNAQLSAKNYEEALQLYRQSWAEMHVMVDGREREVYADLHYAKMLTEEPYAGKNGSAERMGLRLGLVANTCQAYLGLKQYEDCQHWGERSIKVVREAIGLDEHADVPPEQEAAVQMPSPRDMGRIYLYSAIANAILGHVKPAKKQFLVASQYMPAERDNIAEWIKKCDDQSCSQMSTEDIKIPGAWP